MKYKTKKINKDKLRGFLKKFDYNPPDNREECLIIPSNIKFATPKQQILIDELNYNGYSDYKNYTKIEFNDYEIEEYKRIIKNK